MEIIMIRALQFMMAISLLVLLHEGGHMFFAKLFGIKVDKFYVFFDVGIGKWTGSLFRFKPKHSDTEYGIGWLPFGGYCKIAGMVDESFDTKQLERPAEPWEFRSKPAWQRLLVMIGGVTVNFLLALVIYAMIMFVWGETYIPTRAMSQGMEFNATARHYGFRDHDILVGTEKGAFKDFSADMFRDLSEARQVSIIRDGKPMQLALPGNLNLLDMIKSVPVFCRPYLPARIDSVIQGGPAAKIGLQAGDKLVAVNGRTVASANQFLDEMSRLADEMAAASTAKDSLKVRTVQLVWQRSGQLDTNRVVLTPDLKLAIAFPSIATLYQPVHQRYSLLASIPAGVSYGIHVLKGYVSDLRYIFTSDGAKSLGGFGAIASLFPSSWDWYVFWKMTAFLSIMLAFMNILPIPALDGGHVLFLLYEMITRRKPSEKFLIRAEYAGFALLIVLLVVANLNDVLRWLGYM